jgi:hypothetical protein
MTNEQRRLCDALRNAHPSRTMCKEAADTIEWLQTALRAAQIGLAQSDAEPVGGLAKARTIALEQRCERGTPWDLACVTIANKIGEQCGYPPIPTDNAPPNHDASAGLIEAAEIVQQSIDQLKDEHVELWIIQVLEDINKEIRARAANAKPISDPRFVITEVEGICYVTGRGTDTVLAEFTIDNSRAADRSGK